MDHIRLVGGVVLFGSLSGEEELCEPIAMSEPSQRRKKADGHMCPSYAATSVFGFFVSSDTTIKVRKPSGIVMIPGWLNGTRA